MVNTRQKLKRKTWTTHVGGETNENFSFFFFSLKKLITKINQYQTSQHWNNSNNKQKKIKVRWHDNGQFNINLIIPFTACRCALYCAAPLASFGQTQPFWISETSHYYTFSLTPEFCVCSLTSHIASFEFYSFSLHRVCFHYVMNMFFLCLILLPLSLSRSLIHLHVLTHSHCACPVYMFVARRQDTSDHAVYGVPWATSTCVCRHL